MALYNNKGVNSPRRYNNPYMYVLNREHKICEVRTNRTAKGNLKVYYYSWIFQHISLSLTDRSSRQIISKDIVKLNNIINQPDLIDIYNILHPTTAELTIFLKLTWNIQQDTQYSGS